MRGRRRAVVGVRADEVGRPWPVPPRSLGRRAIAGVGLAVEVVMSLTSGGQPLDARPGSVDDRFRSLLEGREESVPAAVFGPSPWCPLDVGPGQLHLSLREVLFERGRTASVPVTGLVPTRVHPPRTRPTPAGLPRSWWVLDVDGRAGSGSIAAPLDALALLGGVARWEPPPGWPVR